MTKIFIEGTEPNHDTLFKKYGWEIVNSPKQADVVLFTGGEDVNPTLYHHDKHRSTHFNEHRDEVCLELFSHCVMNEKPMIGVCRGAQFLNVMNGGSMWQDVNNHGLADTHTVLVTREDNLLVEKYKCSSTHHQLMIPNHGTVTILGVAEQQSVGTRWIPNASYNFSTVQSGYFLTEKILKEYEVLWYEDTYSLCFQPHPEYFSDLKHDCPKLYFELIEEYVVNQLK